MEKKQPINDKSRFALDDSPDAYVISLHINNLIATYGEKNVLGTIKELFLREELKKNKKKVVGE